ncbi:unnamed protein product [Ectocarpus sp. 6 AP-2014]
MVGSVAGLSRGGGVQSGVALWYSPGQFFFCELRCVVETKRSSSGGRDRRFPNFAV